jgi:hypothetical protein
MARMMDPKFRSRNLALPSREAESNLSVGVRISYRDEAK